MKTLGKLPLHKETVQQTQAARCQGAICEENVVYFALCHFAVETSASERAIELVLCKKSRIHSVEAGFEQPLTFSAIFNIEGAFGEVSRPFVTGDRIVSPAEPARTGV